MEFTSDTLQRATEVGYLAATNGMTGQSLAIFDGLSAARPDSELPDIGKSFAHLCAGDTQEAVRILTQEALAKNPESLVAKAFVGLCLKQAGMNAEADGVLEDVAGEDGDPVAKEMATALLAESWIK